jgi:6-phosphogluconolactonase (cycloisomerase 2 family)
VYMNQAGIAVPLAPGRTSVNATADGVIGSATLNVVAPVSRFAYIGSAFDDVISAYAVNINSNTNQTQFIPRGYNLAEDTDFPNGFSVQGIILEPTGRFAYIFSGSTNQIDLFNVQAGGGMTFSGTPALPPLGFPGALDYGIVDPTGRFLYLSIDTAGLLAYSIDPNSGALTALNGGSAYLTALAGNPPQALITDRTGQFLYASSVVGGVYAFSINSDGTLTALNNSLPYALTGDEEDESMAIDPLNQNLYVATNENSVSVWPINSGGTLGTGSSYSLPSGLTLESLAIDPSGTHIYMLDYPPTVTGYSTVDLAALPLTSSPISLTTGPSLSPGLSGATNGFGTLPVTYLGMTIDPGGHFIVVYTAEPNIAFLLSVAPSTGVLTFEPPIPTFTNAFSFVLSTGTTAPVVSAASAFAANEEDSTTTAYTINSGVLTFVSTVPGIEGNSLLAADPFGRYLYALSPALDELYSYSMAASTGGLTPLTSPTSSLAPSAPTSFVVDPSGQFIYLAAGGQYYGFSSSTNSLQPISGSPFTGQASPTVLAADPVGLFLFGLGSGGIDTMVINPEGEVPGPRLGQLSHSYTYNISAQFVAAAFDSSGQFLFALDNANGLIDVFYVYTDQYRDGYGSITEVSSVSTGSTTMSSLAVDPLDRFVVVGDQSGGITTYSFSLSTNVLTLEQTVFPNGGGEIPIEQVAIDPTGSQLFAVQLGDYLHDPPLGGRVLIYSIAANGTVTPSGISPEPPSAGAGLQTTGLALGITTQ